MINKQIVKIVNSARFDLKLRKRVMVFLRHLIKTDHEFCRLILQEVNLKDFIEANMIGQTNQTIQLASDFLQVF